MSLDPYCTRNGPLGLRMAYFCKVNIMTIYFMTKLRNKFYCYQENMFDCVGPIASGGIKMNTFCTMLIQCWADVTDGNLTLNQLRVKVLCIRAST